MAWSTSSLDLSLKTDISWPIKLCSGILFELDIHYLSCLISVTIQKNYITIWIEAPFGVPVNLQKECFHWLVPSWCRDKNNSSITPFTNINSSTNSLKLFWFISWHTNFRNQSEYKTIFFSPDYKNIKNIKNRKNIKNIKNI